MLKGMANPSTSVTDTDWGSFHEELTNLINKYSVDSYAGTPDHLLASSIVAGLSITAVTTYQREKWFGR